MEPEILPTNLSELRSLSQHSRSDLRPPDPRSSRACESTSVSTTGAFCRFASNTVVASLPTPSRKPATPVELLRRINKRPNLPNFASAPETLPLAQSGHVPHVIRVRELHHLPGHWIPVRCLAIEPTHPPLCVASIDERKTPRSMRPFHTRTTPDSTHTPRLRVNPTFLVRSF